MVIDFGHSFQPLTVVSRSHLPSHGSCGSLSASSFGTKGIPVIAITASAMTYNRQTMLAEGFDGYQNKPISVKDFLEEVRRVLDSDQG
jgi:CheY-like chemotaxis protein